jgi:beta-glucosidase
MIRAPATSRGWALSEESVEPSEGAGALRFPNGFIWGAATAAHQVEGGNVNSDWWEWEHTAGSGCSEPSGDACGSYERWPEDVGIVADLGLTSYRFSIEWSRVEPAEGEWSRAALDHYRRLCEGCWERGVVPTVTLHHFTLPLWLARRGGWEAVDAADSFGRYCERVAAHLGEVVGRACTINEPNIVAICGYQFGVFPPGRRGDTVAVARVSEALIAAHRRAVEALHSGPGAYPVGMTLAVPVLELAPGGEAQLAAARESESAYLAAADGDDFIGVQCYTRLRVGPHGPVAPPPGTRLTDVGWEYWPQAAGAAVRQVARATHAPILVTENGVATHDDAERIEYTAEALRGLHGCLQDGIDVRGYFHWSLLDNFEWAEGYRPRFGLVAVDRVSFERRLKPSAVWFGEVARTGVLAPGSAPQPTTVQLGEGQPT